MTKSKKNLLTVARMAELCGVTKAAIKHYEKIGLIKPAFIDEVTGYRYYSISQYETITTIRELRELHISLPDISSFMTKRNVEKSYAFLETQCERLERKSSELLQIQNSLKEQLALIKKYQNDVDFSVRVEYFDDRKIIAHSIAFEEITDEETDSAAIIEVEKKLGFKDRAATLARGRLGILLPGYELSQGIVSDRYKVIGFLNNKPGPDVTQNPNVSVLESGDYVCLTYAGSIWDRHGPVREVLNYIKGHNMKVCGDGVCLNPIDDMVSDYNWEYICDIQIPVEG